MNSSHNRQWKNYEEWIGQLPEWITTDPLWDFKAYRKALFFSELAYQDCEQLKKDSTARHLMSQLLRSATSVPANIEEGYGRGFGKDYARFIRIALGSARESRGWYFRLRHVFSENVIDHRISLATEIIKILTITAKQQRERRN